jgi:hypothetical protein
MPVDHAAAPANSKISDRVKLSVFGPYAQRLDELLTPACFEERALQHAASQVTDCDSELPLRPEEYTA